MGGVGTLKDVKLEKLSDREFRELVDRELRKDHPHPDPAVADACRTQLCESCRRIRAVSPKLRHPEVVGRWIMVLKQMKASSETQLGAKRDELHKLHDDWTDNRGHLHKGLSHSEYMERKRAFDSWRAGSKRFLNSVNARLLEARELRMRYFGSEYPTRAIEERNLASDAYLRLISAIEIHRQTVDGEYDPTDADRELWAAVTTDP